jgi:C4-dicarboxylate-specific signal transduction histidine kinase
MFDQPTRKGGIQGALLRPFRLASILAALALAISLGFLAYTAWTSASRLDPLERHLAHLLGLQATSLDIQEILVRHFEDQSPPRPEEVAKVTARLKQLLDKGGHLHPDTPANLRRARELLEQDDGNLRAGLLAALSVVRRTLAQENALQRGVIEETRRSAEIEFTVAVAAMLIMPIVAMLLLAYIRHRSFRSISQLSDLLDNVGNLNFKTAEPVVEDDPLADAFERYNDMAEKLRTATAEASRRAETLEAQVRTASETLLRQQAELDSGARLAALGEFAARLAHELRNPLSGISIALHNMKRELTDPEHAERVTLIADEMDRVTRLLNSLLDMTPSSPETPVPVNVTTLVDDVIRLFGYQLPPRIRISSDVEDRTCTLPRDTVRQVLINLLKNSREAIGDDAGEIRVEMRRDGPISRLTVSDDGPGYPDDLLTHGIRPFRTGKASGTGLGLSVIQRLVRSAGGSVELSRGAGGGAVTNVTLPCEV